MKRATAEIWEEFSQSLGDFIRRRVSDPEDAEDILQDVFLKIHARIDTLQDDERLVPWLYQIARNTIIDHYRKQRPTVDIPDTVLAETEAVEEDPASQLAAGLRDFITSLPDQYRHALVLTELEGIKQSELADRLGLSISGAKSRVQRGREMLRQALLDCCHFEFDRRKHIRDYVPRQDCCSQCSQPECN